MAIKAVATPRDMVNIFKSGLQAAGYFGSEVAGLNPKGLQGAQHHYLEVRGSPCNSRGLFLSLCVLGDPTWRQAVGAALAWGAIVWKSIMGPVLRSMWPHLLLHSAAAKVIARLPRNWELGGGQRSYRGRLTFLQKCRMVSAHRLPAHDGGGRPDQPH